jgi:hypothetical protein
LATLASLNLPMNLQTSDMYNLPCIAMDLAAISTLRYKPPSETVSVSSIFGEYLANKSQQTQQQSPPPPPPQQQYESPQRHHHLQQQHRGYGGSPTQPGGIFRTPAPPVQPSGLGRSQNHHRGLSAINPQDIMMRSADGNKRKRKSWDGMGGRCRGV